MNPTLRVGLVEIIIKHQIKIAVKNTALLIEEQAMAYEELKNLTDDELIIKELKQSDFPFVEN